MANSLRIDLVGKVVIFKQEGLSVPAEEHPFLVGLTGFGADPNLRGTAIFGTFLSDGERARMDGYDVARLATQEEIDSARAVRSVLDDPESPFAGLVRREEKT